MEKIVKKRTDSSESMNLTLALGPCRAPWLDTSSTHLVSLCAGRSFDPERRRASKIRGRRRTCCCDLVWHLGSPLDPCTGVLKDVRGKAMVDEMGPTSAPGHQSSTQICAHSIALILRLRGLNLVGGARPVDGKADPQAAMALGRGETTNAMGETEGWK
jgi:hypothetical protein